MMNLKQKVKLYRAYLEDLINTLEEANGLENLDKLERESFIQDLINAFSVRSSIEKYFNNPMLEEDTMLLELDEALKQDKAIYNLFNDLFSKYKHSKVPAGV